MELSSYFEPIDSAVVDYYSVDFRPMLGDEINAYTDVTGFPDCADAEMVLLGVKEDRASVDNRGCAASPDHIRHYLYRLAKPYDGIRLADLGNIAPGNEARDTYFALIEVLQQLLDMGKTVVVLGGSDDLVFPIYKAYEILGRVINICSVDSRFNLEGGEQISSNNYLQPIILQQPNYLFDYVNVGYQSYFVGTEMVQLMDELKFTTHRVGELQPNMEHAEPLVRYSDVVAVDISDVRQSDPAYDHNGQTAHMLAHAVWFFLEGFHYRLGDFPAQDKQSYKRFTVAMQDHGIDLVFYKSLKTDRWWMEVPCDDNERRERYLRHTLVPCNYSDYQRAMENEIPELWWHYYNRING